LLAVLGLALGLGCGGGSSGGADAGPDAPADAPDVMPEATGETPPAYEVDAAARGFLLYYRERVERARWIVDAVGQRGETLLRVATIAFDRQRAFLDEGPGHLAPLRMTEVAELLELHVSTVSRAVAGKHAQTPAGIFPLRHFFQAPAEAGRSVEDQRELVRRLFAEEDPASPLSDDEAAERLAARGVTVARRTVAKYRKELGIPSSYRRRRHV